MKLFLFFIVQTLIKQDQAPSPPTSHSELQEQDHVDHPDSLVSGPRSPEDYIKPEGECNINEPNDDLEDDHLAENDDDHNVIATNPTDHELYSKFHVAIENVSLPIMTLNMEDGLDARIQQDEEKCLSAMADEKKPDLNLKLDIPELPFEEFVIPETPKRYMDDGVEIRELRPGFQELGNCKRFWKAQQLIGTRKTMFLEPIFVLFLNPLHGTFTLVLYFIPNPRVRCDTHSPPCIRDYEARTIITACCFNCSEMNWTHLIQLHNCRVNC